jgi:hypothetical protein
VLKLVADHLDNHRIWSVDLAIVVHWRARYLFEVNGPQVLLSASPRGWCPDPISSTLWLARYRADRGREQTAANDEEPLQVAGVDDSEPDVFDSRARIFQ